MSVDLVESEIKQAVRESVNKVIEAFQAAPYSFLYESDIQATLFTELRSRVTTPNATKKMEKPGGTYELALVYSQYGSGTRERIDIVCLKSEPDIDEVLNGHTDSYDTYIYNLPVFVGIELKYRKMGDRSILRVCVDDYKKLRRFKAPKQVNHSLVLGFLQDQSYGKQFDKDSVRFKELPDFDMNEPDGIYIVSPKGLWTYKDVDSLVVDIEK